MSDKNKKDIDKISGVETTGHEWDGLKELNNPLPRWWVWVFIVCCLWSFWYFVIYPAWPVPGGATKGTGGYTQYKELAESQDEIRQRQEAYLERFEKASLKEIMNDAELYAFAIAGGSAAFKDNCATCHGTGAEGGVGYPNLNDDDWLWGGKLAQIHQTLEHGIRADNLDTRLSQMSAFGRDGLLKREEIDAVVEYVRSLSGLNEDEKVSREKLAMGGKVFKEQCVSCHGSNAKGLKEFGAPNLTDKIWLYGSDHEAIFETVYNGRGGMMPAWGERLDENTIKQLTIYVHQLGGGVED
jgi:cytochrome c oxidase cbb3-type subunit 3